MNTEKTFIGFNKSGREILLYRKEDNTYINLLSKDNSVYPIKDIDLSSLVPYSIVMRTFKYKTRKGIVRKYVLDRNKTFNKSKIKMGYICSITNLNVYIDAFLDEEFVWDGKIIRPSVFIEKRKKYKDIIDNKKYYVKGKIKFSKIKEGNLYVSPIRIIFKLLPIIDNLGQYPTKKEVVELSYALKKNNWEKKEGVIDYV